MKRTLCFLIFVFCNFVSFAETKYWIFFKDKPQNAVYQISEKTKQNRLLHNLEVFQETDKELNAFYIAEISAIAQPLVKSRWLNAVSVAVSNYQLQQIKQLPFVSEVKLIHSIQTTSTTQKVERSLVQKQINSQLFNDNSAQNVTIGVIDAGYFNAHIDENLKVIFDNKRILAYRDFVNPTKIGFYSIPETGLDYHGTTVLKQIGGFNNDTKTIYGAAYNAKFYLARTDHGKNENRREEDNWVAAMEWMDSLGVRIINTSLGYAQGFDDFAENYQTSDMNGKTSVITKAVQLATDKKGILMVVSAGNEGNNKSWEIISTPADAEGALTVGATTASGEKANYSSIGTEQLEYIKPEVACYANNGTSFSAPVITGIAACMMNFDSTLSNIQIKEIIIKSSHLYPFANNYVGYGIPNCEKIINQLKVLDYSSNTKIVQSSSSKYEISVPKNTTALVYHKKNKQIVLSTERIKAKKKKLKVVAPPNCKFSTIDFGKQVEEVEWK